MYMKMSFIVSTPPAITRSRLAERELVDRHRQRRQRAGAGRVGDAVGAAEVEAVGDAPGDDVAEQAGEGGLLPAARSASRCGRRSPAPRPRGCPLSRSALSHTGRWSRLTIEPSSSCAEVTPRMHADALAVHRRELALARRPRAPAARRSARGAATCRSPGRWSAGRRTPSDRTSTSARNAPRLRVGLVGRRRVRVVVVVDQPVRRRHVGDQVAARRGCRARSRAASRRAGKERADADDGDAGSATVGMSVTSRRMADRCARATQASGRGRKSKALGGRARRRCAAAGRA